MTVREKIKALFNAGLDEQTFRYLHSANPCCFDFIKQWAFGADFRRIDFRDKCEEVEPDNMTFVASHVLYEEIKPTQIINDIECPAAMTEAPAHGRACFVENPHVEGWCSTLHWEDNTGNRRLLRRGLLHKTRNPAAQCTRARYGIEEGE